jgi:hypothetical protein
MLIVDNDRLTSQENHLTLIDMKLDKLNNQFKIFRDLVFNEETDIPHETNIIMRITALENAVKDIVDKHKYLNEKIESVYLEIMNQKNSESKNTDMFFSIANSKSTL